MKFNTRTEQPLTTNSSGTFLHENPFVTPDKKHSHAGGSRGVYYQTNIFVTPVLSSDRLDKVKTNCLLSNEGVDDLLDVFQKLTLDGKAMANNHTDDKSNPVKTADANVSPELIIRSSADVIKLSQTPKTPPKPSAPKDAVMNSSTKRLLMETPECMNPALGRCKKSMVDQNTFRVVEVTRSLRLITETE